MKLFLTSLVITKSQAVELAKLVGKEQADIKLAMIENAADPRSKDATPGWVEQNRVAIRSHRFDVEIIDIRQYKEEQAKLKDKLAGKDVIWFGGGNTYYLRWLLKDTGLDTILGELVTGGIVYSGGSAGAIMAGPTLKHFDVADDPNDAPELILDGLGLTDSVVVPHMDNPKFAPIIHGINDKLVADGYKTVPLNDAQAFVIDNVNEQVIG